MLGGRRGECEKQFTMHALYLYSVYKRETEVEAVIGMTEGG